MRFFNIILYLLLLFCSEAKQMFAQENVTRFLYVRHGEVPGNDPNPATYIYTGSGTDDSLTEIGSLQAEECAKKISNLQKSQLFGKITAIYSSDLKRAKETAAPIAKVLGLDLRLRPNLREIYWGSADGQLVQKMTEKYGAIEKQIKQQYPERKIRWDYLPVFEDAETFNTLLKRTQEELKTIAHFHEGETILIVGHGRVLKTLIADAQDSEEKIPHLGNCSIAEFTFSTEEGLIFVKVLDDL